jgi:hypothetical protein
MTFFIFIIFSFYWIFYPSQSIPCGPLVYPFNAVPLRQRARASRGWAFRLAERLSLAGLKFHLEAEWLHWVGPKFRLEAESRPPEASAFHREAQWHRLRHWSRQDNDCLGPGPCCREAD